MLRAEGKDVIRNLKKKSVVICDICGRSISSYRWWLPQIAQMHTDVGAKGKDVILNLKKISVVICDICGRLISSYRWWFPQISRMSTDVP